MQAMSIDISNSPIKRNGFYPKKENLKKPDIRHSDNNLSSQKALEGSLDALSANARTLAISRDDMELAMLEYKAKKAKVNYDRAKQEYKEGLISREELDYYNSKLEEAYGRLDEHFIEKVQKTPDSTELPTEPPMQNPTEPPMRDSTEPSCSPEFHGPSIEPSLPPGDTQPQEHGPI